ncbi:MAG: nucleoside triphosphate pyrophosphatase [candidate division WOR-3 bacterium]
MRKNNIEIVLASESKRRIELLKSLGVDFKIAKHSHSEEHNEIKDPEKFVLLCSYEKAKSVEKKENQLIVGSDTIVFIDKTIIGKPIDKKDGLKMMRMLSGRKHSVYTGITLFYRNKILSDFAKTDVYFRKISEKELKWYIENASYLDKAGAYAVQEEASMFIEKIEGDFFNVVGFPIFLFSRMFKQITSMDLFEFIKK